MKYDEITVKTNSATSDIVAYFLQKRSVGGVTIYDKQDLNEPSWDYADENAFAAFEEEAKVVGYFDKQTSKTALIELKEALSRLENAGSLQISVKEIDDESWLNEWKKYFKPLFFDRIMICPKWERETFTSDKKTVYLDSGIAFGTGQHATTSLCIEQMEKLSFEDKTVCDVGCGSGILGLCALKLGAERVTMVDVDSQAVDICRENAQTNDLTEKCEFVCGDLLTDVKGSFDFVLANMTADILLLLAKGIDKIAEKDTVLVLSGILLGRKEEVEKAYAKLGFAVVEEKEKGEWISLCMKR